MYFCKCISFGKNILKNMRKNRILLLLLAMLVVCPQTSFAQEESKLKRAWEKLQVRLDSATIRKFDADYIEVPERPWRIVLRGKTDDFRMDVNSYFDEDFVSKKIGEAVKGGRFDWTLKFNPPIAQSVGFHAGFRGLSFSYSYYLRKKTGRAFSFSSTGARYGLNFRLRRFSTHSMEIDASIKDYDGVEEKFDGPANAPDPIWVRSVIIDGYYLFNGRRFSQAAAYNQSVIQRRSAGSLMLGAMYHQSSLDLATDRNAPLVMLNGDWGRVSIRQFNIGVGYGYNWVPARGWLLNIMLMPTVSTYNRIKTFYYDCNYSLFADEETPDGKKPLIVEEEDGEDVFPDDMKIWETNAQTDFSKIQLNADVRASITYNWNRFFVNIFGQVNNFDYGSSRTNVKLTDWYVRASLGVRF